MRPTVQDGDLIFLAPTWCGRAGYERGAVVVARMPASSVPGAVDVTTVKRVVGRPGEYVRASRDGSVWIDGRLLPEPYLTTEAQVASGSGLSWPCADDEYVLLGDNRADSWGGRQLIPVPFEKIIGKVWLKLPTHGLLGRKSAERARQTR